VFSPSQPLESFEPTASNRIINGARVSTWVMPVSGATRGSDWCEAFALSEDLTVLSIGDVCGHGDRKYATMAAIRQAIRDAAHEGLGPARILCAANAFLMRYDPQEYATATVAVLSRRLGCIALANAGHPPPLLARAGRASYLEYPVADLPLGVEDVLMPVQRSIQIPPESLIVLYTDGVTEHERQPLLGAVQLYDATLAAYASAAEPTAVLIEARMLFAPTLRDDAAILAAWTAHEA
jgi:serine phosphatase RsbU (regulator of sigma subunit)